MAEGKGSPKTSNQEWERYCCPREGTYSLDQRGFPLPVLRLSGEFPVGDAVRFESVLSSPCLVLLGEPGIGKSTEFQRAYEKEQSQEGTERSLWFDLSQFGSDQRVQEGILSSPEVEAWRSDTSSLCVYFDSLDEGLLRVDVLAAMLADWVKSIPSDRLRLRIACRTAHWSEALERTLRGKWEDDLTVTELIPLTQDDVSNAAVLQGIGGHQFLEALDEGQLGALAARPVTLRFLLRLFKEQGQIPGSSSALYRAGCRILCEEPNEYRRATQLVPNLVPEQRLSVARRLAGVTILGARAAIWTGPDGADKPPEDASIGELIGGHEPSDTGDCEVTLTAIREALDTGLFVSRGPNRLGWAHQTYAEHLASEYLLSHDLGLPQLRSILISPGEGLGGVIPQLAEVAARVAVSSPEFFAFLCEHDPASVLRADLEDASEEARETLTKSILGNSQAIRALDSDWGLRRQLKRLDHPNLERHLVEAFSHPTSSVEMRRLVLWIGAECGISALVSDAIVVALDRGQPQRLRLAAIDLIGENGTEAERPSLRELTTDEGPEDPDDEVKAAVLMTLWPDQLSVQEVLSCINPPKNPSLIGMYSLFLGHRFPEGLEEDDIGAVLDWIAGRYSEGRPHRSFSRMIDAVLWRAWQAFPSPESSKQFFHALATRLEHSEGFFRDDYRDQFRAELAEEVDRRRGLVSGLVPVLSADRVRLLLFGDRRLVEPSDVQWLLTEFEGAQDGSRESWARLIEGVVNPSDAPSRDALLSAIAENASLAKHLTGIWAPVELESEFARRLRELHTQQVAFETETAGSLDNLPPLLNPSPKERIQAALDRFEGGDTDGFWHLVLDLELEPTSRRYAREHDSRLFEFPGWQDSENKTRVRILRAAKNYLKLREPATDKWLGKNRGWRPDQAAFKAIRLLWAEDPTAISGLSHKTWAKWLPIILSFPIFSDERDAEEAVAREITQFAINAASGKAAETVGRVLSIQLRAELSPSILGRLPETWTDEIRLRVLDVLKRSRAVGMSFQITLAALLDRGCESSKTYSLNLLLKNNRLGEITRERRRIAATELLLRADSETWPALWTHVSNDPDLAESAMGRLADRHSGREVLSQLTEPQLANWFSWLEERWPFEKDPSSADGFLSMEDQIRRLRDEVLFSLRDRGTIQACHELVLLRDRLPHLPWLSRTLDVARSQARRLSWDPPTTREVLEVVRSRSGLIIRDGGQLLSALVESLGRLQRRLQGENALAFALWDMVPDSKPRVYRPKPEGRFSDFVRDHLERDLQTHGAVANREVEIRAGEGAGKGEETDIYVSVTAPAASFSPPRVSRAILECKGQWNLGVFEAMETQLVDRYLADNDQCNHGLFVVGWASCPQWDPSHYASKYHPNHTMETALVELARQAQDLTAGGCQVMSMVLNIALR